MKHTVLLFLLILSPPLMAIDKNGIYYGFNGFSCADYAKDRPNTNMKSAEARMFILGYVNAYNEMIDDVFNILGTSNMDDIYFWMDNYCSANPLKSIASGLTTLTKELWPNRTRSYPPQSE